MKRLKRKWGLTVKAGVLALLLLGVKAVLHVLGMEVVTVGPVITALVAGVFFVLAIILSGVMADFKESEKVPGEMSASIEALYADALLIGNGQTSEAMRDNVRNLTHTVISNFRKRGSWKLTEVNAVIEQIDGNIRELAAQGAPLAVVVKMRNELGNIKKMSNRVEVIKEVPFLPAGHAIAEFATGGALTVMLLLKVEPFYEGLLLIGVIASILIGVVLLIRDMDNPFEGYAQVDVTQLHKLDRYVDERR